VANTEQGHDYLLIGFPAIIPHRFGSLGLFSHHLYRVRPNGDTPLTALYLYHLLLTSKMRQQVTAYTNGTTVNMLAIDGLQRPVLALSPQALISRFEDVAAPIQARLERNEDEIQPLAQLRDTLLPKLLSGELRVGQAEQAVGAAL
jgi:type I restriction enzyme S subunit